jgi:hypothetical protein
MGGLLCIIIVIYIIRKHHHSHDRIGCEDIYMA